jgi:hypothetical protein
MRMPLRPVLIATLIAGTLDILSAFFFSGSVGRVLRYVASGPFGDAVRQGGIGWALAGLAVHFAIMFCMAYAYFHVALRRPKLLDHWALAGLLYGVVLWGVMYWLVKPLRWPDAPLPHAAWPIAQQLFSHCLLTGLPIAWVAHVNFPDRRSFT